MALDELIHKYLSGKLNLEEQHRLNKWLNEQEVNPEVLDRMELFWNDPTTKYTQEGDEVYQDIFKKIEMVSHEQTHEERFLRTRRRALRYISVAATVALLVAMFFLVEAFEKDVGVTETVAIKEARKTLAGQKLQVHLRDGSKIKLNAESSIEFPKYFSDSTRVVSLRGEAYFEVAEDANRPFNVVVGDVVVKALGTSFSIRSEHGTTKIFLTSGKVSVKSTKIEDPVMLSPGEMVIENNGFLDEIKEFEYDDIAWKDNVLVFREASSSQVFQQLEKWYGVDIHVKDDLGKWSFSGQFENEPLKEVLLGISHSEELDFEIQNKEVVIKTKKI